MNKIELEDIEKVLPGMKFFVLAVENVDLSESSTEYANEKSRVFSASTLQTKSDFIQAAVILTTDEELREVFKMLMKLTEDMLSNPEIQEHLKNVLVDNQKS